MKPHHPYLPVIALLVFIALPSHAENQIKRFEAAESKGVTATRAGNILLLEVEESVKSPIKIPRLAAPLRYLYWEGADGSSGFQLKPEPEHWVISWKNRPKNATTIVLSMDAPPRLLSELKTVKATGDGSFYLPAHLATTTGEKVRYEPQPNKNTVGYWVGKQDAATWTIHLDEPGRFNVAVLQGCGKGQGGSTATMSFISPVKDITPKLDFEVVETGHFQNFQWVRLGEIELRHAGEVEVNVVPKQIKKAALMDIRAIHLIRLPDKK
jgi:hypothetical protein